MDFLKKLFNAPDQDADVDYYREGVELLEAGRHHEALTSLRLALREAPGDVTVLQQIAITYTRIGMTDEAVKTYRDVLSVDPDAAGAHYGLAFLLLREGKREAAREHLRRFLQSPPGGDEARSHVEHARQTLADLEGDADEERLENIGP